MKIFHEGKLISTKQKNSDSRTGNPDFSVMKVIVGECYVVNQCFSDLM